MIFGFLFEFEFNFLVRTLRISCHSSTFFFNRNTLKPVKAQFRNHTALEISLLKAMESLRHRLDHCLHTRCRYPQKSVPVAASDHQCYTKYLATWTSSDDRPVRGDQRTGVLWFKLNSVPNLPRVTSDGVAYHDLRSCLVVILVLSLYIFIITFTNSILPLLTLFIIFHHVISRNIYHVNVQFEDT